MKFDTTGMGGWQRDAAGLPAFVLDLTTVPAVSMSLTHALGNSRVRVLADHRGNIRVQPAAPARAGVEAVLLLTLETPDMSAALLPLAARGGAIGGDLRCGCGMATLTAVLQLPEGVLNLRLEMLAPADRDAAVFKIACNASGNMPAGAEIHCHFVINRSASAQGCRTFQRDLVGLVTEVDPVGGDFFAVGSKAWQVNAGAGAVLLSATMPIGSGGAHETVFLAGWRRDCTIAWAAGQGHDFDFADAGRKYCLSLNPEPAPRPPELWMLEECTWTKAMLAALHPVIADMRLALTLAPPLAELGRPVVRNLLRRATAMASPEGRLPEVFDAPPPTVRIDPERDRSDLEILLLLAWMEYVRRFGAEAEADLDEDLAAGASGAATAWVVLKRLCHWLQHGLGRGQRHGLPRLLAGDWCGGIDRAGAGGQGESVLNGAMLCYALELLAPLAARRREAEFAESANAWLKHLRSAVAASFAGNCFARAWNDAGVAVGAADGRVFTDVQAWAVLARCGTPSQRLQALQTVVAAAGAGLPPLLAPPFGLGAVPRLFGRPAIPGAGANGGWSPTAAAWFVWALAAERQYSLALPFWERLTIRRRAHETPELPPPVLVAGKTCGVGADDPPLPHPEAVAWQAYLLRRILA